MEKVRFRNAIQAIFGGIKNYVSTAWKEIGNYTAQFWGFGTDIYANEVVRACIRSLAEHSSKANVKLIRRTDNGVDKGDQRLQRLIQYRPNIYMNGKDFLYKVRTLLEINNTVFIYIQRDDLGRCIGLYPMPTAQMEALDVSGRLYIRFRFNGGAIVTHSWEDLAVLRKDYNTSDIFGDSNSAILDSLELLNTTNQGMANAIKSTANLRGILKTTKSMLSPDDVKANKDQFIKDYLSMENSSGIVSLDSTQEYTPINTTPQLANYKSVEELRNNIYRYFGVNDDVLMSKVFGEAWEAFYESKIEPFLLALGLELTNKIFTGKQIGFGNEVIFESNRMAYMSMSNKLALVQMVDRKALTPNEWREVMNLAPVPWGDAPQSWQNPTGANNTTAKEEDVTDDNKG